MAQNIFNSIHATELQNKLTVVGSGTDGTAFKTGKYNGCIQGLGDLLNKPLQWACYIPMSYL